MTGADLTSDAAAPFATPVPGRARRRAETLAPLSREHHHALKQAMDLKRAREETAQRIWQQFVEFWERDGNSHFIEEESELLPASARVADPNNPAVVRMLLEHVLIRAKVAAIRERHEPPSQIFGSLVAGSSSTCATRSASSSRCSRTPLA